MSLPEQPTDSFPYQIDAKIGEGAMGVVYRAHETSLERTVAIKILKPDFLARLDPTRAQESMQRFLQEARAAARLSHPGITTIFRVGVEADTPYIAMEWLDGQDLETILERKAPIDVAHAARLGVDLLETLATAHNEGIVHRDIKPANVMILTDGRVKVADFGVARMDGSDLVETQAGAILGTPLYACPEQLRGEEVDARADLYSVAIVLYEALTGRLPFEASNILSLIQLILSKQGPITPSTHNPLVPVDLSRVLMTAMSRRKEDRFPNALSMADALRPFLPNSTETSPATAATIPGDAAIINPATLAPVQIVQGNDPTELIANLTRRWESKPLGQQNVAPLLEKLLERPLHAPAFSGVAHIGRAFLLLHNGLIYAVFDPEHHFVSDAVYEDLPASAPATLHPVPPEYDDSIVISLASILHTSRPLHSNLDTSFVDVQGLVSKLIEEGFDGAVKLQAGAEISYLFLHRGQATLHLFSDGWPVDPFSAPWPTWISRVGAKAHIEERHITLSSFSYRRELHGFELDITPMKQVDGGTRRTAVDLRLSGTSPSASLSFCISPAQPLSEQNERRGDSTMSHIYTSDPVYRFLSWMGRDMFSFFEERDRLTKWKYLAEWVTLVRKVTLHQHLERPKSGERDFFDLITQDEKGKILHLGHRSAHGSAEALQDYIDRVLAAKTARLKTGDIGGAFFIAPQIDDDALALYDKITSHQEKKKSFLFGLTDSVTGYEGFVRIGARRGFHLLLISETEDGFKPILPAG